MNEKQVLEANASYMHDIMLDISFSEFTGKVK